MYFPIFLFPFPLSVRRRSHGRVVAHRARDAARVRRGGFLAGDALVVGCVHCGHRRFGLMNQGRCGRDGGCGRCSGRCGWLDPVHRVFTLYVVRDERHGDRERGREHDNGDEVPPEGAHVGVYSGEECGGAYALGISQCVV